MLGLSSETRPTEWGGAYPGLAKIRKKRNFGALDPKFFLPQVVGADPCVDGVSLAVQTASQECFRGCG